MVTIYIAGVVAIPILPVLSISEKTSSWGGHIKRYIEIQVWILKRVIYVQVSGVARETVDIEMLNDCSSWYFSRKTCTELVCFI